MSQATFRPDAASPTFAGEHESGAVRYLRTTLGPLLLILLTPPTVIVLWVCCRYLDGSLLRLLTAEGVRALLDNWPRPSLRAAEMIAVFALLEAALLRYLPGRVHLGPVTPAGDRPVYRLNGVAAYFVTHGLLCVASYRLGWFSPAIVYDELGPLLATLCVSALLICLLLYLKGVYAPSGPDRGASGNFIWDYYWGVELHPRLFGMSLKQLINCRVAMMGWSVIILSFAAAQRERYGQLSNAMLVSVALQVVYIIKFFVWEGGYFGSLDIMHDRFGFYICWGVLCWLPGTYTITAQYLVTHPVEWPPALAALIFLVGVLAIWANYDADAQRQRVRESDGQTTVWGRAPELIRAEYETADGQRHKSLLLVSGWWGVARHFHYVSELTLALCWSLPAGGGHLVPYFYFLFLTCLLMDRAGRDDLRCRTKYGAYWEEYCQRVRWRVLPGVY